MTPDEEYDPYYYEERDDPPDVPEDYEPGLCPTCNGSGEGRYEGTNCYACKGKGEI